MEEVSYNHREATPENDEQKTREVKLGNFTKTHVLRIKTTGNVPIALKQYHEDKVRDAIQKISGKESNLCYIFMLL